MFWYPQALRFSSGHRAPGSCLSSYHTGGFIAFLFAHFARNAAGELRAVLRVNPRSEQDQDPLGAWRPALDAWDVNVATVGQVADALAMARVRQRATLNLLPAKGIITLDEWGAEFQAETEAGGRRSGRIALQGRSLAGKMGSRWSSFCRPGQISAWWRR